MGEVIDLKPKGDDLLWLCSCSCQTYRIYSDGSIECANCKNRHSDHVGAAGHWVKDVLPEAPETTDETTAGALTVTGLGSEELAVRRVLKHANDWRAAGHLAAVIAYHIDGTGQHWVNITNDEQRDWLARRIEGLLEDLKATKS